MTSQDLVNTKPRGKLECRAGEVIKMFLEGAPERAVAAHFGATLRGVQLFKAKHADAITTVQMEASRRILDVATKDKETRIRRYDEMLSRIDALIDERGGLEAVDRKWLGGEGGYEVEVRRFDAALVREWRGLHRDIAEELGEIPKNADAPQVNVAVAIQLVWPDGSPA